MGKIKQGILGGFSGKVGSVIGGSWKGKNYMRGQAVSTKDPQTLKQKMHRAKFALVISTLQPLTPFLRIGFKNYAKGKTAYNAAMSYTFKNTITGEYPNYKIDYEKLLVSRGNLTGVTTTIDIEFISGKINLTWDDNSGVGEAQPTDSAMIIAINPAKGESVYITEGAPRSFGNEEITTPLSWADDQVEVYLSFVSEDGKNISTSTYCGSVIISF